MTRTEIIVALNLYTLHAARDYVGTNHKRDVPLLGEEDIVEDAEDGNDIHGLFGYATDFLDPSYRLLDLLTPHAKQNRLSYLVELLLDKYSKGISNEALKIRLRKDSIAFGAEEMPTDVRSIGRFLGARTLQEVTRHRCGNDECSYAWIGEVHFTKFDVYDCCLDCGTPRYKRKKGALVPQRVFFYFGAARAIEALHNHPVFRANWKKKGSLP